ncbi:DsbC family protein [Parvularcula oceani]|uniref:DsbC family protein n=1 Tax=Parvularcula oceani TaxID=1247963 RepID=UPI0004E1CF88|nr:DsbC family protein [Parvularcula oceani]
MLTVGLGAASALGLAALVAGAGSAQTENPPSTEASFAARFPETTPDVIACEGFGPLCQVIAGRTVFYIDPEARHAFIGHLYDLEAERDLTAVALEALAPEEAVVSEAEAEADATAAAAKADWDALPWDSAVLRNEGGRLKVAVFSDLNCGYCRQLSAALDEAPDIEAREFLMGMAGSEPASLAVGCADDPEAAIRTYYRDQSLPAARCDRNIVEPARQAARALGPLMRGTPTFVRPDGAVTSGFRDIESLRAWLEEGVKQEGGEG